MSKRLLHGEAELLEPKDLEKASEASYEHAENIAGGAIGYPNHWARFTIETPSASVIRVKQGQLFKGGTIYDLDEPHDEGLTGHLPTVAGDMKYVAVLVRGKTETIEEHRYVEIDEDTEEVEYIPVPKYLANTCGFIIQAGVASPTPVKPSVDDSECCIAYVLLSLSGVEAVEHFHNDRVKTLYEVEGRVSVLEAQMKAIFARTLTLETDLANVQADLKNYASRNAVRQLQEDMAQARKIIDLPDAARAYFYDPALVGWAWSKTHASWNARVDEGIRFPFDAFQDTQLTVQNPEQSDIKIVNNVMMLNWVETTIIEVDGPGSTRDISNIVHEETTLVARHVSRSSVSYGPTVAFCGNTQELAGYEGSVSGQTFQANGETFQNMGPINAQFAGDSLDLTDFNATHGGGYDLDMVVLHNSQIGQSGNRVINAARSVQVNSWTETHWDEVTTTYGVNGSIYSQTFPVSQAMILTSIDLKFSRVGGSGDVTLFFCEADVSGDPLLTRVIAASTVSHADLAEGWVNFPFEPRYLPPGKRYSWATSTAGNHALHTATGNIFTGGTLGWSTDGVWSQGSPNEDFLCRINGTLHTHTHARVLFNPLNLPGGMTQIKLLYEAFTPDGTSMIWRVRTSPDHPWQAVQAETVAQPNPLRGLPETCQLELTMIGLGGLSPALLLNEYARGEAHRHKFNGRGITKELEFGLNTTTIDVKWVLDQFDPALHTATPKVMVAGVEYEADADSLVRDVQRPTRFILRAEFTVPETDRARSILDMTTTDIEAVYFVENTALFAT